MTIAITGATGRLGRLILDKLKARINASAIAAIVRDAAKGQELGVSVRQADYNQPQRLDQALAGIETLLLISSSTDEGKAQQHINVIEAAAKAGVKRIAYTSTLHADTSPIGSAPDHLATERALRDSGLTTTILRNGWYMENHAGSFRAAMASGILYGCAGKGRFSSATRSDYADAAVEVLVGDRHDGKVYELAGDASYTLADAAAELSRHTGKSVVYRDLDEGDYVAALTKTGMPRATAAKIANFDIAATKGALFDEGGQLSTLIAHATEPLATTIAYSIK